MRIPAALTLLAALGTVGAWWLLSGDVEDQGAANPRLEAPRVESPNADELSGGQHSVQEATAAAGTRVDRKPKIDRNLWRLRVVRASDGVPVPGALVQGSPSRRRRFRRKQAQVPNAHSDAAGLVEIEAARRPKRLTITAPGFARTLWSPTKEQWPQEPEGGDGAPSSPAEANQTVPIVKLAAQSLIQVELRDLRGRALPGYRVEAARVGERLNFADAAGKVESNSNGIAEIGGLASGKYRIAVSRTRSASARALQKLDQRMTLHSEYVSLGEGERKTVLIEFADRGDIVIHVRMRGQPVVHGRVALLSEIAGAKSNPRVEALDEANARRLEALGDLPGIPPFTVPRIQASPEQRLTAVLTAGQQHKVQYGASRSLDKNGSARFRQVRLGRRDIEIRIGDHRLPHRHRLDLRDARERGPLAEYTIDLQPARVRFVFDGDPSSLDGANCFVRDMATDAATRIGVRGRKEIDIADFGAGDYQVELRGRGIVPMPGHALKVVAGGQHVLRIKIPAPVPITVRVTGKPRLAALFYRLRGQKDFTRSLVSNGERTLTLAPGTWEFKARKRRSEFGATRTITVREGFPQTVDVAPR